MDLARLAVAAVATKMKPMLMALSCTLMCAACSTLPTTHTNHDPASSAQRMAAERQDQVQVMQRAALLLERYAMNDPEGVLALLDREQFTIFGSDISEVVRSEHALRQLMEDDFALWRTASFTEVREVDFRTDGTLATVHFVASFSPGGGPALPVRFAMTWRKTNGEWWLTQSANSVPTRGQSAAELRKKLR